MKFYSSLPALDVFDDIEDAFDDLSGNDPEEIMVICFAILIGIFVALGIALLFAKAYRKASDSQYPERREPAVLTDRRTGAYGIDTLVFQLPSGERVIFDTNEYKHLVVGDQGYLNWQGRTIKSFFRADLGQK